TPLTVEISVATSSLHRHAHELRLRYGVTVRASSLRGDEKLVSSAQVNAGWCLRMKRLTATYSFALLLAIFTVPPPALSQIREVRTIPLVAMTHDGRVVGGLTAQNLRVRGINGRVDKVTLDAGPRHIILLLDVSGSMREESDPSAWDKA